MKSLIASTRMLLVLTVLTGIAYPVAVWAIGEACFHSQAEGSLVTRDGKVVGSLLFSQKTVGSGYFWPRPSADDYGTVASGASNLAWTSAKLQKGITDGASALRQANKLDAATPVPDEMLTASASGLDPEISPTAALQQVARIAATRHLSSTDTARLQALVPANAIGGGLSPQRVNVLALNLALDAAFGATPAK